MNKFTTIGLSLMILFFAFSCTPKYETVLNDPTATRIYTLDNGLKVYMSVNKDAPRIQTFIPVRVGGKNDPHETTGLAHYFEHLMFKGTEHFGTQNYELEKPMLDEIEALFETYRKTTDEAQRKAIYHKIDSVSYEASKIAIPNEYDKLMAAIGSNNSNAYTSYDQTVYIENIPSNQLENWAKIQSDRFACAIIRGFHTELETVYEEKNMSLTQDNEKVIDELLAALFHKHPYGTQTILGTQQNLKNPSITNIKNYYNEWYVPNNMAICMSGDFDPDQAYEVINKYFSKLHPNPNLKKLEFEAEDPITSPIIKDVYGLEAPSVTFAWRFPSANDKDICKLNLLSQILYNGQAGLVDLDVNQQQKTLGSYAGAESLADYSFLLFEGRPKQGQTLDEVREILLAEVEKIKKGEFDESMMKAVVNNYKLDLIKQLEGIGGRVRGYVDCFINGISWADYLAQVDQLSAITKDELVAYANEYMQDNYACIRKQQGKDETVIKVEKPEITPIFTNRDTASQFMRDIQTATVVPIEPVFVDYKKDMDILTAKSGIPVFYKQNTTNELFSLIYLFEMGNNEDKMLALAAQYLDYLGTADKTPEQIKQAFYSLACSFGVATQNDRTYVSLSGLGENMNEAISLLENLLADAQANPAALDEMKAMTLQYRMNDKLDQSVNFSRLQDYCLYGPKNPSTNLIPASELSAITDSQLLDKIHGLTSFEHTIMYYGPQSQSEIIETINSLHKVPATLVKVQQNKSFAYLPTKDNSVLIAPYDAKQIYLVSYSVGDELYDPSLNAISKLYNMYFGSGMNTIVFQEMREARGLAYSAQAQFSTPADLDHPYLYFDYIATQNDKMIDAITAFDDIINNMPQSQKNFDIAKESILSNIRTSRTIKSNVFWSYLAAKKLGLDYDINRDVFEKVQNYTLQDIVDFQQKWVKGRKYTICILGDENDLDMKGLEKYGKINRVKTEDIFGY